VHHTSIDVIKVIKGQLLEIRVEMFRFIGFVIKIITKREGRIQPFVTI
jgi:hypothetical protein